MHGSTYEVKGKALLSGWLKYKETRTWDLCRTGRVSFWRRARGLDETGRLCETWASVGARLDRRGPDGTGQAAITEPESGKWKWGRLMGQVALSLQGLCLSSLRTWFIQRSLILSNVLGTLLQSLFWWALAYFQDRPTFDICLRK